MGHLCVNCGRAPIENQTHSLCSACYTYHRRNGTMRPERLYNRDRRECVNCGVMFEGVGKRCRACTQHYQHHGRERRTGKHCGNCGVEVDHYEAHGMCNACYRWQHRHGEPRPAHKWATACSNCGRPRVGLRNGLCAACDNYQRRHGRPRPARNIIKQAPLGWCECGRPAAVRVPLRVGADVEQYDLCRECAEAEGIKLPESVAA